MKGWASPREDNGGYAGRVFDWLIPHFGSEHVFMDVNALQPGEDFVDVKQADRAMGLALHAARLYLHGFGPPIHPT